MSRKQLKDKINSRSGAILSIAFDTPDVVPDILHGQIRKCQRAIQKLLDTAGFGTIYTEYYVNHQTLMLFELKRIKLSEMETHMGPPDGHENVKDFKEKWNNSPKAVSKSYKKDKRWYVDIKREFTTPIKLIKSKINSLNVGKHITIAISEKLDIYEGIKVIQNGYEKHLTKFLSRKYSWEF
jgi:tRNA nucleotidyltransferase (CCA-adding enzyme)